MSKYSIFAMSLAAASLLAGCARNGGDDAGNSATGQPEFAEEFKPDPLSELFMKADALFSEGKRDEVVALLNEAEASEEFADQRPQILQPLVRILIDTGDIDAAKAKVLQILATGDQGLSDSVAGIVFFNYMGAGDTASALAWADEVLATAGITPAIRDRFLDWSLNAAVEAGDDDRVASTANIVISGATDSAADSLRRFFESLASRGKTDLLATIINGEAARNATAASIRTVLSIMGLRVLAAQDKWDELVAAFPAVAASLSDKDLNYTLRNTVGPAMSAARYDVVDAICGPIVADPAISRLPANYAARQWVEVAAKTSLATVPVRIESLIGGPVALQDVISIYSNHAYDNIDDPSFATPMKALAERLLASSTPDGGSSLRTILLDFCFILEDYDTALALLAEGFPGYDETWHEMATSKVSAHKALRDGKPLEAIEFFRKFMAIIAEKQEDTSDPSTGVIHTREMILGRNAARIGGIYASIPDPEKAAAAYAEARDYFTTALESARDDVSADFIRKELSEIPAQ